MTLVNAETGEIVTPEDLSAEDARHLTDQIKVAIEGSWLLIKQAYLARAWVSLGYLSWDEYCTREFGASRLRLPREERQEVVGSLREAGLSMRAIAAATGLSKNTVLADSQRQVSQSETPAVQSGPTQETANPSGEPTVTPAPKVTGTDGKQYDPTPANPQPKPRRSSLADDASSAGWNFRKAVERMERIAADDRFPANREQVAAHLRGHLSYAIEVCQDLLDGFDTEPQEAQ